MVSHTHCLTVIYTKHIKKALVNISIYAFLDWFNWITFPLILLFCFLEVCIKQIKREVLWLSSENLEVFPPVIEKSKALESKINGSGRYMSNPLSFREKPPTTPKIGLSPFMLYQKRMLWKIGKEHAKNKSCDVINFCQIQFNWIIHKHMQASQNGKIKK